MSPANRLHMVTCTNDTCRLRFPVAAPQDPNACPACGAGLRADPAHAARPAAPGPPPALQVAGLLDNVRSVANVGAMLRTADAAGMVHVDLVGITASGDHDDIDKTALGAQHAVAWRHHRNGPERVAALRADGCNIWVLESTADATALSRAVAELAGEECGTGAQGRHPGAGQPGMGRPSTPRIVVVVGHEVAGGGPGHPGPGGPGRGDPDAGHEDQPQRRDRLRHRRLGPHHGHGKRSGALNDSTVLKPAP